MNDKGGDIMIKDKSIFLRLTETQYNKLKMLCNQFDMNVSEYLRYLLKNARIKK